MWTKARLLKRLFEQQKVLVILTFCISFCAGILTLAIPVAIGQYYTFLFGYHSLRAKLLAFVPLDLGNINVFLGFFIGLVLLRVAFSFGEKYLTGVLGQIFVFDVRNLLFERQLQIPVLDYEDKGAGRYLLRFSGDLNSIKRYLTQGIIRFVNDSILILLTIGLLLWLDWRLGIFLGLGLLIPLIVILALQNKLSMATRTQRNRKSRLLAFTNSRLQAIHTIQIFNKEKTEQGKFNRIAQSTLDAGIAYQKIVSLINALIPGMLYLLMAGLFAYVYYFIPRETQSGGGNILIFIIVLLTIIPVIRRMLKANVVWELGNISFEKLLNVFRRAQNDVRSKPNLKINKGHIVIDGLYYCFQSTDKELFKSLSISIPDKQLTLIEGGTGSGKSTLIKLICGLYRPQKGNITIDGQDISRINGKSLRRKITVISDEWPLLGKTVFEAISYSRKQDKREPAQGLLDFLQSHNPNLKKMQLDDSIGDRGSKLSKGQRKLLAYARGLLTEKPILLVDEPLLGLDPATHDFWLDQLNDLAKNKTVVLFTSIPISAPHYTLSSVSMSEGSAIKRILQTHEKSVAANIESFRNTRSTGLNCSSNHIRTLD